MASNISIPLNIEDPIVLRRILVEIIDRLNKPTKLELTPSVTYNAEEISSIVAKINEIIDKN